MADDEIQSVGSRRLTPDEARLLEIFNKIEESALEHMEEAARQLIQLVTALYSVIFGVLALGAKDFGAELRSPWVLWLGALTVLFLFGALLAAFWTILPLDYFYRGASLDDKKATYRAITQHKTQWLYRAFVAFLIGAGLFAGLAMVLLWLRFRA